VIVWSRRGFNEQGILEMLLTLDNGTVLDLGRRHLED
jgi:hypothetical protein